MSLAERPRLVLIARASPSMYLFRAIGVTLPRTAQQQYDATIPVGTPQFADLVFFQGTCSSPDRITHVGIYVGNGEMVSEVEPHTARESITKPYWTAHFTGYGRLT